MNQLQKDLRELGEARDYKQQGALFLQNTGTTLEIVEAVPQTPPEWSKDAHGIKYSVTLKNKMGAYTFSYWGSISDAKKISIAKDVQKDGIYSSSYYSLMDWCEEQASPTVPNIIKSKNARGVVVDHIARTWLNNAVDTVRLIITPKAYDILTCLHPMSADTFEEFCSDYGYDEDSRSAEKTYNAMLAQDRAMRKLFTSDELEALSEIA